MGSASLIFKKISFLYKLWLVLVGVKFLLIILLPFLGKLELISVNLYDVVLNCVLSVIDIKLEKSPELPVTESSCSC